MKWLTQKEVAIASKKSGKQALLCCREHWQQLLSATKRDFERFKGDVKCLDCATYCALCQRYYFSEPMCFGCPLDCLAVCFWGSVDTAFVGYLDNYSPGDRKVWKLQAKEMLDKINKVIKRLYGDI